MTPATFRYLPRPLSPFSTKCALGCYNIHCRAASTQPEPRLDFTNIDRTWRSRWAQAAKRGTGEEKDAPHFYVLPMFPYPSGTLHIGHLRVYTISDVLARFKRMQGYNVLHPMGWDAFGLPAENAAIERGIDPAEWTIQNIESMKYQLQSLNASFDWSREFMTCNPNFYKHTQRIFLMLHERGLAYQAEALVNYDPVDKTVLANEQVDASGRSWRSGVKVEKRSLKQWFLRITDFKKALHEDLNVLSENNRWPERVLSMQRNWLGKSTGVKIKFLVKRTYPKGMNEPKKKEQKVVGKAVDVFTTRPDTLHGVQYVALSITHPIVAELEVDNPDLQNFIKAAPSFPADSKAGYLLPNVSAENPLSVLEDSPKYSKWPLPVYVAPYVLENYGEGAVMGVPGHDARDFAFWTEHNTDEPIRKVVAPLGSEAETIPGNKILTEAYEEPGMLTSLCGCMAGLESADASQKIIADLADAGDLAQKSETWKLRDWLISRQRYWGTPIPIIHCQDCGAVPVPYEELPVELPKLQRGWFRGKGGNPLENAEDWVNTVCPECGSKARRDTDTMDTFMDSSWYFMRFADPHNADEPFSNEAAKGNLPVDIYIGGVEHAILHLLYARFIAKFLATTPLWSSGGQNGNKGEPFRKVINQGMVHGKTYLDPTTGRFVKPEEVDASDQSSPKMIPSGQTPSISWEKMSKSKYNGIDPMECIGKYGADITRAHILFQAPVSDVLKWEEERIVGIQRWFHKIWRLMPSSSEEHNSVFLDSHVDPQTASEVQLWIQVQRTIGSVTLSMSDTLSLNTVISDLIKLTNAISSMSDIGPVVRYQATSALIRMLAPVAPAFAEMCWEHINETMGSPASSVFDNPFPVPDGSIAIFKESTQTCAVQENGKLRFAIQISQVPTELLKKVNEAALEAWVLGELKKTEEGNNWLARGRKWKRIVVIKGGKTVNFVP